MYDGALTHFSQTSRSHLNQTFGNRLIVRWEPTSGPVSSLDLLLLDLHVWDSLVNAEQMRLERNSDDTKYFETFTNFPKESIEKGNFLLGNISGTIVRNLSKYDALIQLFVKGVNHFFQIKINLNCGLQGIKIKTIYDFLKMNIE